MHQAPQPRRLLLLIISGLSLLVSHARAQAPARPTPGAAENYKVTFSPFVVSGDEDTAYAATHSLAVGRINTELTREFLDDLGAVNYMDEWSSDPVLLRP
jgi:hypothetical protein